MTQFVRRVITTFLVLLLLMPGMLLNARPVLAGSTIAVNTFGDEAGTGTLCSLREAIISANTDQAFGGCVAGNGADTIRLLAGKYELNKKGSFENEGKMGDLDINNDVTITGAGKNLTTIYSKPMTLNDRIFHIHLKSNGTAPIVTFEGLLIEGGRFDEEQDGGGGILNEGGIVTLSWVTLNNNAADSGGGIWNRATSKLTIKNSSIYDNFTYNGTGGGILNDGTLTITASDFGNNKSDTGGAIDNRPDTDQDYAEIINSTIANNVATRAGGTGAAGITNSRPGKLILKNSTVAKNDSGYDILMQSKSIMETWNSIIASCVFEVGTDGQLAKSEGYNIINFEDVTGANLCNFSNLSGRPDLMGVANDPNLEPYLELKKFTKVLEFNNRESKAIDAIPVGDPSCPHVDQLLHGRPADVKGGGAKCDIGAYEEGGISFTIFLPLVSR